MSSIDYKSLSGYDLIMFMNSPFSILLFLGRFPQHEGTALFTYFHRLWNEINMSCMTPFGRKYQVARKKNKEKNEIK